MQFNQAPAPRESSIGDAYDPTASYSVDDLCIHDNVLYKCTTAISGGEAWNSEHWTETNIGDEISALNSNLKIVDISSSFSKASNITGMLNAYKVGNIVNIDFNLSFPSDAPSGSYLDFFLIPTEYRPMHEIYPVGVYGGMVDTALFKYNPSTGYLQLWRQGTVSEARAMITYALSRNIK